MSNRSALSSSYRVRVELLDTCGNRDGGEGRGVAGRLGAHRGRARAHQKRGAARQVSTPETSLGGQGRGGLSLVLRKREEMQIFTWISVARGLRSGENLEMSEMTATLEGETND